jgi:hypothetical protein
LTVNRADLIASTATSSLEAGSGTVGIQVKVDGTTVTRTAAGALTVSACEALKAGVAAAGTSAVATDRFMVIDAAGNCQTRVLPAGTAETVTTFTGAQATGHTIGTYTNEAGAPVVVRETVTSLSLAGSTLTYNDENGTATALVLPGATSGAATTVTAGAVNVDVDGTTVKIVGDALTVDGCEVLKASAVAAATTSVTGDKVLALDAAGNCVPRALVPSVPAAPVTNRGSVAYVKDCATGLPAWGNVVERFTYRTTTADTALVPSTDRVVIADTATGNVTVTLAAPSACDPTDFHIKKSSASNVLTVTPQAGATIDGLASVIIGAGNSGFGALPSLHVAWTGTTWIVL